MIHFHLQMCPWQAIVALAGQQMATFPADSKQTGRHGWQADKPNLHFQVMMP
jgi:hypothetical protein